MKKIIAAFDGLKYSVATEENAVHLASQQNALLVGVFLYDLNYHSYRVYDLISEKTGSFDTKLQDQLNERDATLRQAAIHRFKQACDKAGVRYLVHEDHNAAVRELVTESIYADLLIMDKNETFSPVGEELPTSFSRDLLPHLQCPVLVVTGNRRKIRELVLLYDGEPSSVHAIKMLSYVMPDVTSVYAEVLTVIKPGQDLQLPDAGLITEFIYRHFPHTHFQTVEGDPENEILSFLQSKPPDTLVVAGAYRRSSVSRWFRPSMADILISRLNLPLFIAHNR